MSRRSPARDHLQVFVFPLHVPEQQFELWLQVAPGGPQAGTVVVVLPVAVVVVVDCVVVVVLCPFVVVVVAWVVVVVLCPFVVVVVVVDVVVVVVETVTTKFVVLVAVPACV